MLSINIFEIQVKKIVHKRRAKKFIIKFNKPEKFTAHTPTHNGMIDLNN